MAVYHLLIIIFSVISLPAAAQGQCAEGAFFKNCTNECPKTCDYDLGLDNTCTCVDICLCPNGTLENRQGRCVQPSDCLDQTPELMNTSTLSVSSSPQVKRTTTSSSMLFMTINNKHIDFKHQVKIGIIAGSSAAAAVILIVLILVVLPTVMLVRKAKSKLEKGPGSRKLTVGNRTTLDTTNDTEILVEVNEAYAVTTQGNIAYADYTEYDYI